MNVKKRFEIVKDECRKHLEENIQLPRKSTKMSIAYDFFSPVNVAIFPKKKVTVWTDVKVKLSNYAIIRSTTDAQLKGVQLAESLDIIPRSSIGIKHSVMLANTMGLIDPDYYSNESNDGNIALCLYNYGEELITINKGERFAQGSIKLNVVDECDDDYLAERKGGLGSTGK